MPAVSTMSRAPSGPVVLQTELGSELLVDTIQLVEPKRPQTIPNHILETKIYSNVAQNAMVQARPPVLHFGGFDLYKKHSLSLSIVNVSTDVIRMHIIPPQTKYFHIKYSKSERLVPGLTIECIVSFVPDEWRYYYDCIRINCPGEENLLIPLHAYPTMSTQDFPRNFNFAPVPVGNSNTKVFPLNCDAPVDFEFQLLYVQPHPAFSIEPMSGIIPASGCVDVSVTFSPMEFHTACMKVQLSISQFNASPFVCTFIGNSTPGLLKEKTESKYSLLPELSEILDPRLLSPLDRARSKHSIKTSREKESTQQDIEYKGIRFASNLQSPYAVAQVLNQEPGKMKAKDLREVVTKKDTAPSATTRQMKEAMFAHKVRQNVYEERQNQLRWQVRLGEDQITGSDKNGILAERASAWDEYKYKKRGDPIAEEEYLNTCTECTLRRTMREASETPTDKATFDTYSNNMWAVRHSIINRFAQAARKVVLQLRAEKKLKSLRNFSIDWKKQKLQTESFTAEQKERLEAEEQIQLLPFNLRISSSKIKKKKFPTYVPPNVKDDMAPDALGMIPFKQTIVVVQKKVPYFNLKVPQVFTLMGYNPHTVHDAASGYVPPRLARTLRTGAEDEVISLPVSLVEPLDNMAEQLDKREITLADLSKTGTQQPTALTPPQALIQPIDYPSLHIFNPAPGLQVFQSPMPYAEADPDFHLCPLPRYSRKDYATNPHASTQRKYLDREDVIKGVMTWKKFPSQGLTSLTNTPTLTSVWLPRWDNQLTEELLPSDPPPLLSALPDDDKETITEEEEDNDAVMSVISGGAVVSLTPEMVNAQFSSAEMSNITEEKHVESFPHGQKLPASNIPVSHTGPIPKEKREEELEYFISKKYNKLGSKIHSQITHLNSLITDPKLVLK